MSKHRIRLCVDCHAGQHDFDTDSWRNDFLRLLRRACVCEDCTCRFIQVRIEEPTFDNRHFGGYALRKPPGRRRAA